MDFYGIFKVRFFLLNNDQRIYPPVSPAAYHEISWCIVLRQSCRASDWWRMWVKQSHTHTHTHTPPMTGNGEFIPPGDDWGLVYCLTHMISFEIGLQFGYKSIGLDETSWDGFPNTMIPSTRATSHGIVWTRKKQTVQVHTWHDWLIDDDYLWLMMITDD